MPNIVKKEGERSLMGGGLWSYELFHGKQNVQDILDTLSGTGDSLILYKKCSVI